MTSADYMREYRARREDYTSVDAKRKRARSRAMQRLKDKHAAEYRRLLVEECGKEGVEPPR